MNTQQVICFGSGDYCKHRTKYAAHTRLVTIVCVLCCSLCSTDELSTYVTTFENTKLGPQYSNCSHAQDFRMEEETDGQRLPAAEIALDEEKFKKLEMEADLRLKEDTIRDILSPHEGTVMSFQGLLVWENPRRSFVLLLCVNGFVW